MWHVRIVFQRICQLAAGKNLVDHAAARAAIAEITATD
jgi:hypothetical protein